MLQVRNLSKTYTTKEGTLHALKNVSVDINPGEIFGFIGLSGAGKTSLARCVSALEKADSGEIIFQGADITKQKGAALRTIRKKMGFVFQHFNLLMNATVFENIAFPLRIARQSSAHITQRVNELMELVGLTDKSAAYPATLSGGQKQRVGIARALASEPELVICDEATSALDPDTTRSILSLIRQIGAKTGVTFIVITHEMDVIKELCTHVAVMEGGEIIESGPVLDVLTAPKTPTAKRFFSKDYIDATWINLPKKRIFRAIFIGEATRKAFIHDVIRKFDIELSILSGNIESVGGTMVGSLILEISGKENILEEVQAYFHENNVGIKELSEHVT
ncbi:MAG: ATP-binding cassette domain-containing protein [Defluviitaleaceae bacterium]|nr:ATP-binding cassette domain-containing protein [Defluviitaleaceae bacterium]